MEVSWYLHINLLKQQLRTSYLLFEPTHSSNHQKLNIKKTKRKKKLLKIMKEWWQGESILSSFPSAFLSCFFPTPAYGRHTDLPNNKQVNWALGAKHVLSSSAVYSAKGRWAVKVGFSLFVFSFSYCSIIHVSPLQCVLLQKHTSKKCVWADVIKIISRMFTPAGIVNDKFNWRQTAGC